MFESAAVGVGRNATKLTDALSFASCQARHRSRSVTYTPAVTCSASFCFGTSERIVLLERHEQPGLAGLTAREQTLILRRVELPVRLQLRRARDPAGRSEARVVAQLGVADRDPATTVLLLEQDLLDHLVERLVLDPLLPRPARATGRPAAAPPA